MLTIDGKLITSDNIVIDPTKGVINSFEDVYEYVYEYEPVDFILTTPVYEYEPVDFILTTPVYEYEPIEFDLT